MCIVFFLFFFDPYKKQTFEIYSVHCCFLFFFPNHEKYIYFAVEDVGYCFELLEEEEEEVLIGISLVVQLIMREMRLKCEHIIWILLKLKSGGRVGWILSK